MQLRPFSVPAPFKIMGILNCTPDSFSDGGRFIHVDSAIRHACQLVEDGADIIDIGAESTRPGAVEIPASLEWERLEPVLNQLQKNSLVMLPLALIPVSRIRCSKLQIQGFSLSIM